MDRLAQMRVFVTVVERRSFTEAARTLDMAKSTVSRQISDLESRLSARLLYRTTRNLHPTEAGRTYFSQCQAILRDVELADASVQEREGPLRGTLRISSAAIFATQHLVGPIAAFRSLHPGVDVELRLDDRYVNMVEEGLDLAIRIIGSPPDSSLVARRLATTVHELYAAKSFLTAHPVETLADLREVPCLVRRPPAEDYHLVGPDGPCSVPVHAALACNQAEPILEAARRGMGVALLPNFMTVKACLRGDLVRVLPEYTGSTSGIFAVYPHRQLLSQRVRAFVEHLKATWAEPVWEA